MVVELPEVEKDRYLSIQIADQEHYTIYEEIQPAGKYAFIRKGKGMKAPEAAKGVELFWSVTRYSALTRNTIPGKNDLFNAYNTKPDENGKYHRYIQRRESQRRNLLDAGNCR